MAGKTFQSSLVIATTRHCICIIDKKIKRKKKKICLVKEKNIEEHM